MTYSGEDFLDVNTAESKPAQAESRAWNCFYHSGKVEDYIRYAQLRHRENGAADADQDRGPDY